MVHSVAPWKTNHQATGSSGISQMRARGSASISRGDAADGHARATTPWSALLVKLNLCLLQSLFENYWSIYCS